jgi:hypothetical protein
MASGGVSSPLRIADTSSGPLAWLSRATTTAGRPLIESGCSVVRFPWSALLKLRLDRFVHRLASFGPWAESGSDHSTSLFLPVWLAFSSE